MAFFDRFDICEAYYLFELDWNKGGWLRERASNRRRHESTDVQLHRMGFKPGAACLNYDTLSENAKDIYSDLLERYFKEAR